MQTLGNDGDANHDAAGQAALMRAGRRLLWALINDTVLTCSILYTGWI